MTSFFSDSELLRERIALTIHRPASNFPECQRAHGFRRCTYIITQLARRKFLYMSESTIQQNLTEATHWQSDKHGELRTQFRTSSGRGFLDEPAAHFFHKDQWPHRDTRGEIQ